MAPKKKPDPMPEQSLSRPLGTSGLRKSGGYVAADFLPQLHGLAGAKAFAEMASNDPVVGGMLFATTMLLRGVEWAVEGEDAAAVEVVEHALFRDLQPSWAEVLSEVCTMFIYGFAPMEVTWVNRDGWVVPKSLGLRGQESIVRWEYGLDLTRDKLLGLHQQDWERPAVFIPRPRFLLFRTDATLDNPEGRSVLRSAYVSWQRKKSIEEAEGRAALRAAGLVVIRIPGEVLRDAANAAVKADFVKLAEDLANDRHGGIVLSSDIHPDTKQVLYEVQYVVADGRRSADMSTIVERIDKRIAASVLADFILLGQQAVGSFALSSDKTALFTNALWGWLQLMAEVFNRELLGAMWRLNGKDTETMPKLVPGDIETPNLAELSSYIATLAGVGMPLFPDPNLEAYLRQAGGLPDKAESAAPVAQPAPAPGAEEGGSPAEETA